MTKDTSMKKIFALLLATALLAAPAWGYDQEDLDKLKATNTCKECDLTKANQPDAYLTWATLSPAIFCRTIMPERTIINDDC